MYWFEVYGLARVESFFKISPHFFACSRIKSISSESLGYLLTSFLSSFAITVIVDSGVPKEWAAAAA